MIGEHVLPKDICLQKEEAAHQKRVDSKECVLVCQWIEVGAGAGHPQMPAKAASQCQVGGYWQGELLRPPVPCFASAKM